MSKVKYLTEVISCSLSKDKFAQRLDELLNLRANEGWKLSKCESVDSTGYFVVIFEKSADVLD